MSPTNRRATQLELGPAGQAVLDEFVAMHSTARAEVTRRMSPDVRRALPPRGFSTIFVVAMALPLASTPVPSLVTNPTRG